MGIPRGSGEGLYVAFVAQTVCFVHTYPVDTVPWLPKHIKIHRVDIVIGKLVPMFQSLLKPLADGCGGLDVDRALYVVGWSGVTMCMQ